MVQGYGSRGRWGWGGGRVVTYHVYYKSLKLLLPLLLCTPNPKVVKSFDLPWHLVNNIRGTHTIDGIGRGSKCVHKIWHNDDETGKSDRVKQMNSMSKVLRDTKFIYTPARTFTRFTCKRSIGSTRCAPAGVPCCVPFKRLCTHACFNTL